MNAQKGAENKMNGYKMQAEAYRAILSKTADETARADLEAQIKVFEYLADCTEQDLNRLYNSSAFNDITKGYVAILADELEELTDEQRSHIKGKITALLDRYTAGEAKAYYYSH